MMPRLWHGMTWGDWRALSRGQWARCRGDLRLGLYASITALSFGNSLMHGLGQLIHGRALARTEIRPDPVFVLGYWRSGTTWLHQLLSCDPRFCSPTSLQVFMPKSFLMLRHVMRPLAPLWLPGRRPMDSVALEADSSEEDEVALLVAGAPSVMRGMAFDDPEAPAMTDDIADLPEALRADWHRRWRAFLTAVQYLAPDRQLLLKSPGHTMRLAEVLRAFPQARFIHILRDPYEIAQSNILTAEGMTATQTLRRTMPARADLEDGVFRAFRAFHEAFERDRALIPEGHYTCIRYEDLRRDPKAVIQGVYDAIGLGEADALEPALDRMLSARKGYRVNEFSMDTALARRVEREWAAYFRRYGYSRRSGWITEDE
ncbi:sulfotransferase [Ferrimonas balearica]|nr:sulfotransferase [Ferrimonas balearica]